MEKRFVLITGATGYIGGRLVPKLLKAGYPVRAMARSTEKIKGRTWFGSENFQYVQADLHDPSSLEPAVENCSVAYYLVHSMFDSHGDFAKADRRAARNFVRASDRSGLKRIIYLGGLGGDEPNTSLHLKSRREVENILKSGRVPVTVFRCAHILGSGSASFEMLRYMVERVPFFIVPEKVIETRIQPICIRNVLGYLQMCLDKSRTIGRTFDIGGPEILTYRKLFETYAEQAGLGKPMIFNSHTPPLRVGRKIAQAVAKMMLPLSPAICQPLLEGVTVETIVKNDDIKRIIPLDLVRCCSAIDRAIQKDSLKIVETRWTDAGELDSPEWMYAGDAEYAGGTLLQGGYRITLACSPDEIWSRISRIGGYNGWYYGDILWQIRGWLDQFAGGVGLRRGRRHPEKLYVGDALDFWRVLEVSEPLKLILVAEMKLPGEALLNFELVPLESATELRLGTRFRPKGLYGIFYWYSLLPFHNLLFGGMLNQLAKKVGKKVLSGPSKYRPGPLVLE